MTLRVTLEIVPFGREDKKYTIETLNISNVTLQVPTIVKGEDTYIIEHNDYKNYDDKTPKVPHKREDGALTLVRKALERLGY